MGPVSRDFTVTHGEVRYIGTLDAQLDIEARHTVHAVRGDEIPVIATIQGTLYAPKLRLESTHEAADLGNRPGLLPHRRLSGERGQRNLDMRRAERGLAYFSSALVSELERALIQDHRRPDGPDRDPPRGVQRQRRFGVSPSSPPDGNRAARRFVTFNAGFCPDFSQFSYENIGAEPRVPLQPASGGCRAPSSPPSSRCTGTDRSFRWTPGESLPDRLGHAVGARVLRWPGHC